MKMKAVCNGSLFTVGKISASSGARTPDCQCSIQVLNPLYRVDASTVICWMSPFVILGVLDLFCRFYSIFDGKSC